jgi:tetraacyldisaccharide 4'-kinase
MPSLRRRWYTAPGRQHRLRRPVISIGNLSMGGRGKTPLVAHIARMLVEAGERPAILARGYGRRRTEDGVVVVSDGTHLLADVDRSGDEPLMLARDVPGARVLVCDQRALAGALAERLFGATVHLLDDGFQHLALARDIDLVIVNGADAEDRPVPFGRLRESMEALSCAHAVIVDQENPDGGAGAPACPPRPDLTVGDFARRFSLHRQVRLPIPVDPDRSWTAADRRVIAVAGIANPARFAHALAAAGWTVVDRLSFADHHQYTPSDLGRIAAAARRMGAAVVTTAKDAIRLLPMRPLPVAIAYVPLDVTVEPAGAFRGWLFERLRALTSEGRA